MEDDDTDLLRKHHAKLATRIVAINLDLETLIRSGLLPGHPSRDMAMISKQLDNEQAALEQEHIAYSYIISAEALCSSPIRRIPEIFVSAMSGGPHYLPGLEILWLVTQVCVRWRNVACAHPGLWSSFRVPLRRGGGSVDLLSITLERCRDAVLTVVVEDLFDDPTPSAAQKLEILAEHAENIAPPMLFLPRCSSLPVGVSLAWIS
jgi:hypothetical protein